MSDKLTHLALKGTYNSLLASVRGRRLWHQLLIDEDAVSYGMFIVEIRANGETITQECGSLAKAIWEFNKGLA